MSKFAIDQNGQRIIRFKDEMPDGAAFNEGYVQYAIPFSDVPTLVENLKQGGYIKPEANEVPLITDIRDSMLDRQLAIIEKLLATK